MPGSTPATSQLDWLISTTAITVLSWSRATRDLLKSFGWGIRALHQLVAATMVPSPRRLPHTISPLEEDGFEPSVPREKDGEKAKESISHKTASAEGSNRAVPTKHPFLAGIEWRYPSGIRCQRVCRFRRRRHPQPTRSGCPLRR